MKLEDLIKKRLERINDVPSKLISSIEKNEEATYRQIIKDINSLESENGKIKASKSNLAKINGILENLKKVMLNEDYVNAIKEFAVEIGTQAKLNNQILSTTVNSFSDDELFKAVVSKSQQNALAILDENAIIAEFINPISELLTNAIVTEMSFSDASKILRENMVGENAIYRKYAGTYVKDAFSVADRQYNSLISKANGIEFYKYEGLKVESTRYFCCVRKGNIYHIKEIESWADKESLWVNPKESGKCSNAGSGGRNPDTNKYNITSLLGGYNCQDILTAVPTEYAPKKDIERAIELGYYKP